MYPLEDSLHPTVVIDSRLVKYLPDYLPWQQAHEVINPTNLLWVPRSEAEATLDLTQVIPSAIISAQPHQYHTFKRRSSDFEQLANKVSIIIGGHCDYDDIQPDNYQELTTDHQQLSDWAQYFGQVFQRTVARELMEEVGYNIRPRRYNAAAPNIKPVAVVRDQSSTKTAQHLAIIYPITCHHKLYAAAPEEFAPDVQNNGILKHIHQLQRNPAALDPWTRIISNHITSSTNPES